MKAHFEMMAAYNAWANRRLCAACAGLSDADFRANLGAFFGSLLGTLNHLIVTDLIWLARFRGQTPPAFALDAILHDDRAEVLAARRVLDADILAYVQGLSQAELDAEITYTMVVLDQTVTEPRAPALAHFFNHQTHHRGQAHALLTRLTGTAPSLDLAQMRRGVD